MGIFDTYGSIQLKAGKPWGNSYEIGDKVKIPDGVYLDEEGIIVINDGIFVAEIAPEQLFDYWGNEINIMDIVIP
jgi:hypothetical protein